MKRSTSTVHLGIAFLAFVSLGLPDGVLGIAWPSIRRALDLPLSQLGALLAAAMAGYFASSFASGPVVLRIGLGRLLLWSSIAMVASSAAYALAPTFGVVTMGALVAGLGAGAIDAGINAFAATRFSARIVNWLHACYGIGATLGPLLMTGVLSLELSWRWGYGLIGLALAGMAACFAVTLDGWAMDSRPDGSRPRPEAVASLADTLRHPRVGTGIALFFLYTGLEVAVGQWTYSLLTEGRGLTPGMAGVWTGTYWGGLTVGRIAAGAFASRLSAESLLRLAVLSAPLGALLVWAGGPGLGSLVGLVVLGCALAPIFPLLVAVTPMRVGQAYAAPAIGLQIAAAYLGTAAIPGGIGLVARWTGLESIGPALVGTALALALLHEIARRQQEGSPRELDRQPAPISAAV